MSNAIRPGRGVPLIADKVINHAKPHYQGGLSGIVQKQDEPKQYDSLASRTQVQAGIKYFLKTKGECEVLSAPLAGATLGAPVYITRADDTLTLVDSAAVEPFGRVSALAGTNGLPTTELRVDMDHRDFANA